MKRTYHSPETKVVRVVQHLMTEASQNLTGKNGSNSFAVTFSDEEYGGEAASRRHSQWDDEENEY